VCVCVCVCACGTLHSSQSKEAAGLFVPMGRCTALVRRNVDRREVHCWAGLGWVEDTSTVSVCSKKYTLWVTYSSVTLNRVACSVAVHGSALLLLPSHCFRSLYAAFKHFFPSLFKTVIITILYLASSSFPFYLRLISLCSLFLQRLLPALRFSFVLSLSFLPITVVTFLLLSHLCPTVLLRVKIKMMKTASRPIRQRLRTATDCADCS
jgi:hypothetical protein